MRSMEISLNAAFKTADALIICGAINNAVRSSSNILRLAEAAGISRVTLYRAFKGKTEPRLDTALNVLGALGFQLVVKLERLPPMSAPNPTASGKIVAHPELRSKPTATLTYLAGPFKTADINAIVKALADILRAQENVQQFANKAGLTRATLYHAFTVPRTPRLSMVVSFLHALGLRLAVQALGTRASTKKPPLG